MFNLSGSEVLFILVIGLVVLGPEKLPEVLRRAGRLYGELRRMSQGVQTEVKSALDETTRELRSATESARSLLNGGIAVGSKGNAPSGDGSPPAATGASAPPVTSTNETGTATTVEPTFIPHPLGGPPPDAATDRRE